MEAKAESNYSNDTMNKDEFINVELEWEQVPVVDTKNKPCYSMVDLWLVLIHTFLYISLYYGLSLTSYQYSEDLGIKKSLSGVLQAITPIAATVFGFYSNYITMNNKYRYPYFLSISLMFVGTLLYHLAHTFNDNKTLGLGILIAGRVLIGMGGSRLVTRKFIAINVEIWAQNKYSMLLVAITAFAICFGPGLQAVLMFANDATLGPTHLFDANIMAFMFIFVFAILLIVFFFFFKGQSSESNQNLQRIDFADSLLEFHYHEIPDLVGEQMLLREDFYGEQRFRVSDYERPQTNSILSSSNLEAFRGQENKKVPFLKAYFPNVATVIITLIFLIIKIVQETFFTEIPQLSKEYYQHSPQWVGWFYLLSTFYG